MSNKETGGWAAIEEELLSSFEAAHGYKPAMVGGMFPSTEEARETIIEAGQQAQEKIESYAQEVVIELRGEENG